MSGRYVPRGRCASLRFLRTYRSGSQRERALAAAKRCGKASSKIAADRSTHPARQAGKDAATSTSAGAR
jgi:hypothetical protein